MALGGFWDRIRSLYRNLAPRMTQRPTAPRMPSIQQPPVPQAPTTAPVGPLDPATVMDTIVQAGRQRKLLQITYDGVTRLVEPYSFRDRGTGRQFYGWCSIHGRIHSFIPHKIEAIQITNVMYAPRWDVEF